MTTLTMLSHLHVMFGWWWTGHQQITMAAVPLAVRLLSDAGKLAKLGTTEFLTRWHLKPLWTMNVCQDADKGNAYGECGVEYPGGQVNHFMRDTDQDRAEAYLLATVRIRDQSKWAWMNFAKAYKPAPKEEEKGGFWHGVYKASPLGQAEDFVKTIKEGVEALADEAAHLNGQLALGRALHTLQDSFSPAHTLRGTKKGGEDGDLSAIHDIYAWDDDNKNAHDDWMGHKWLDKPEHRTKLVELARDASRDLIVCCIGNALDDKGAFTSEYNGIVSKYLQKAF